MRQSELIQQWYDDGHYGTDTMRERLAKGAAEFGDYRCIVWSNQRPARTTLGELHTRGVRLAGALLKNGIGSGDVVAMQMPSWMEAAVLYHACSEIGAVVLPIIHVYGPAELDYILDQSKAKMLVTPDQWMGIPYSDRGRDRDLLRVIVGDTCPDGVMSFAALEEQATDDFERPDVKADDLHILMYTSGTTAKPKGVRHTHNSLLFEACQMREASAARVGDVFMSPNPVGHIAGVMAGLQNPYLWGLHIVIMDGWSPPAAAELIATEKVTSAGGAPYFLTTLLDIAESSDLDLSSMRYFGTGGAGVAPALMERAAKLGWVSSRAYGATEHMSISACGENDPVDKRANTDGRLLPGVEARIVDDDDNDLPVGESGEILSRGPDMFIGYADDALNAAAFTDDGFYRTGDIGCLDADGFLTITGRKKDIIIRGGENISAQEVENVLLTHKKVLEAAVTSMPDERYGEKVCAFVICRKEPLTMEELSAHFAGSGIAKQKTPERLEVVDDFPRTLAGKVKKYVLRESL